LNPGEGAIRKFEINPMHVSMRCAPQAGYLGALLLAGARSAARSSAMMWRKFSMPSLVKAGTPSLPTP
jgi:hypothetical protein